MGEAGESEEVHARHLAWCRRLAADGPAMAQGGDPSWLICEEDNLRGALEWALAHDQAEAAMELARAVMVICRRSGRYREARQAVERAAALAARVAPAAALRAEVLLDVAAMATVAGEFYLARARAEEALAVLGDDGDAEQRSAALMLVGFASMFVADPDTALGILHQSVSLVRTGGVPGVLAEALATSGRARMLVGDLAGAEDCFEECRQVAEAGKAPIAAAEAHIGLGWAALVRGDYGPAESHLRRALAVAQASSANHLEAVALSWLGDLARLCGDPSGARATYRACRELAAVIETPYPMARALLGLGRLAHAEGDVAEARALLEEALALARRTSNGYLVAACLEALGEVARSAGESSGRALLEEALALARARQDRVMEPAALYELGQVARREGDLKEAAAGHHDALCMRAETGERAGVADSLEAMAALAVEEGWPERALRLFAAAEALRRRHRLARLSRQTDQHEADVAAARAQLDPEAADELWAEGSELSLGAAVAYAGRGRGRGRQGRPAEGWEALTPSECQVAQLVAEGLTNREIADRLYVSPRTVQSHLRSIFTKLRVPTRAALTKEVHQR